MIDPKDAKYLDFDGTLPLERARTIPSDWYHSAEIATLERNRVFGNSWQWVGRVDQVARPGMFVTAEVAGEPVAVVRDEAGTLRAFHNVCRHRAARVLELECGIASRLRCRYHGWTYDLSGRLRGIPEFDGVLEFERSDHGLVPLQVDTWGPWVFVHFAPSPPALGDFLAPLPSRSGGLGMETLRFVERREYLLACNWKVFVDNYLDGGYHVNTVHPALAGVLDYAQYRTEIEGNTSVQISPLRPPDPEKEDASAAAVRQGTDAHYWWVFPNLMINVYAGIMDTNLVLPLGPDRCRVLFDFYFADSEGEAANAAIRASIDVAEQIQAEDIAICEEVQKGLASRSYRVGRFSVRREAGGYHFHRLLAAYLAAGESR
ncbi:MAG: SRPBCC family protein [Planctomycetota bacterium]